MYNQSDSTYNNPSSRLRYLKEELDSVRKMLGQLEPTSPAYVNLIKQESELVNAITSFTLLTQTEAPNLYSDD